MPRNGAAGPAGGVGRSPLSQEAVLRTALAIADAGGAAALTMRSVAQALGVKPMSLYHHVANKDAILDGIVDVVFAEIYLPVPGGDWRAELHRRAASAREVLGRHAWAVPLLESRRTPGPATLRHHEANLAVLRTGGFPLPLTAHAYALIDAYVYGFALQEAALPFTGRDTAAEVIDPIVAHMAAGEYPYLMETARDHVLRPGYDFGDEFDFGITLILDGLAAMRPGQ